MTIEPRRSKPVRDFWWILISELFTLRLEWFWYFFQVALTPIVFSLFLWLFIGRVQPEALAFIVSGSLVMTISSGAMLSLGQHIGWLKGANAYEHYAALPISKTAFIAALATRGVLLAVPSVLAVSVMGGIVFGIWMGPATWVVLILSAYAMSGIGAFIGFWSPTAQVASLATQVVQPLIILFAPVYFPMEQLPFVLQVTSHLLPTTYAAQALRGIMAGASLLELWPQLIILLGFAAISLRLVPLRLDWRGRS